MSNVIQFDGDDLSPDQIPTPTGWQIILAPIKIQEKTSGGIIITNDTKKLEESSRFVSKVLAIGPLAYTGERFKAHPKQPSIEPWCKVGDVVSTGQYSGSQIPCVDSSGKSYYLRLVADDEIKTVISDTSILNV